LSSVPYIFATASGNVPASQLDANFANVKASVGTVTTAAQPNITSVGTLTVLSVSGNITGSYFYGNGSQLTGINTSGGATGATGPTGATGVAGATGSLTGNLTANINGQGYSISNVATITVTGNVIAGNVIANNLSGPVFIANVSTGQGIPTSPSGISQLPLMYDNISANIGGGYAVGNSVIGSTFTAPVSGFYQVSAAIGVTPSNWANVTSYSSVGAIGVYKNNNPVAAGTAIDFIGLTIGNVVLEITTSSSISTLVELDAGDTIDCKLAYVTTAPTNFWNTSTNLVQGYFQTCWIRGT
jgi:hypothetical protein